MIDPNLTARVDINSVFLADTGPDLVIGTPTALSGLAVTWGRSTTVDQPGPATCVFTVADRVGGAGFLSVLTVGARVDVKAAGQLYTGGLAGAEVFGDPGFEAVPVGGIPSSSSVNADPRAVTTPVHAGTRAIRVLGHDWSAPMAVTFPPAPFAAPGRDPDAWDHVPATTAGAPWVLSAWVRAPAGTRITLTPVVWTAPWASVAQPGAGAVTVTGTGSFAQVKATHYPPADGRWVGLTVTVTQLPRWVDLPPAQTWLQTPGTWQDYGAWYVDDISAKPTAASSTRTVLVFTGRVTDLETRWTEVGGVQVTVTAADPYAELGNTMVGDQPWLEETLGARVTRILSLAGGKYTAVIDPAPAARLVTWRDVDRQGAAGLIAELGASADAVAWMGTHAVTGPDPYVWVEDTAKRTALHELDKQPGKPVTIIPTTYRGAFKELSACRVLADPIRWRQSVADVSTVVDVTWREQTLDDKGLPAPTERHVTLTDPATVGKYGTRRVGLATQLSRSADATAVATRLMARLDVTEWRISGLVWDTVVGGDFTDTHTTLALDLLDGQTRLGHPLVITELPAWSPAAGDTVACFVEGGTLRYDDGRWVLDMSVTSATGQGASVTWQQLDPTWRWVDFDPAIRWADLIGVGP